MLHRALLLASVVGSTARPALISQVAARPTLPAAYARSAPPLVAPAASPLWGCSTLDRGLALTYDDGPGAFTDRLLDILRDANATASFFVLVWAALVHPDTVRRIVEEGHTLGLHTWGHANLSALAEAEDWPALKHEIDDAADQLEKLSGQRPRYFRPPYGALTTELVAYLHKRGFAVVMWSGGCFDWSLSGGSESGMEVPIYINGLADAGGILCMHDVYEDTVKSTPALLAAMRSGVQGGWANPQGREAVSLDHCSGRCSDGNACQASA